MDKCQMEFLRAALLKRLGHVASKKFCLFRMIRMHRLTLRIESLERAIEG